MKLPVGKSHRVNLILKKVTNRVVQYVNQDTTKVVMNLIKSFVGLSDLLGDLCKIDGKVDIK